MLKHVDDPAKLEPGMEIKIGRNKFGRVISTVEHSKYGTCVFYRDFYGGGVKIAQLENVRIETKRRKVKGAKFAK